MLVAQRLHNNKSPLSHSHTLHTERLGVRLAVGKLSRFLPGYPDQPQQAGAELV
jgi:hypothetical protein